jgi:hypothetical protein
MNSAGWEFWRVSVVGVFGFDFELLLAGLAHPMVFAFNKSVVVDTLAVIVRAHIALHHAWNSSRFYLGSSFCADSPSMTTSTRRFDARPSMVLFDAMGRYSPYPTADIRAGGTFELMRYCRM